MNAHYEDMVKLLALREPVGRDGEEVRLNDESGGEEERRDSRRARRRLRKIGVFFCGPPVIGRELADRCSHLSARGRADGTGLEYHFMLEVFG